MKCPDCKGDGVVLHTRCDSCRGTGTLTRRMRIERKRLRAYLRWRLLARSPVATVKRAWCMLAGWDRAYLEVLP